MKRSSCLSAMLVGLSVMTASVAFAAPAGSAAAGAAGTEQAPAKTTLVAQAKGRPVNAVQPSDPPPAEGGGQAPAAPADGAAAPGGAPGADPAPQPAITLGSASTPGADVPAGAAEEPKKKPKPRPWAGSQIFTFTSMSTATVFQGQQQDYNPTVDASIWLQPRYAISDAFQLRGLLVFNYEFTNSDTTQTRNEPRFSDTMLSLWYRKLPEIPGIGVKPMVALNTGLPSSPESRARTLVVNPGLTLQLVKAFEHVLGGDIMLIGSTVYSHPLYRYETPGTREARPYQPACVGDAQNCGGQLLGTANPSDVLAYSLILVGEWGKFSPAMMYRGTSQWVYTPTDVRNPVDGTMIGSAAPNPTSLRQLSYFSFWLDYNANSWFTAEVGYWMSRAALDEDGQRGNPFFNRYQDMRVYLGANFNIDNILKSLEGGDAEAGVVRAKAKSPMFTF